MKIEPERRAKLFTTCLNQQASAGFVPISVEEKTLGMSFEDTLCQARPETDRATLGQRINPASDALLLNMIDKMPRDLLHVTWSAMKRWLTSGNAAPEDVATVGGRYQIGKQKPIDGLALLDNLCAVMREFPDLKPHIGAEHVWSPESQASPGVNFAQRLKLAWQGKRSLPVPIFGSKLISALGMGATSVTMPTGQEKALKSWVCDQEDASIELHQLFRESYRLCQGDLYATLLCAENVLSEGLYTPDRQQREVTRKLSYLRSDSAPDGDNFGAWYHLMGSALYALMRPEWKASLVLKIENAGSFILEGADPQESYINQAGLELGQALRQVSDKGLPENAQRHNYVNLSEFAWDRKQIRHFLINAPAVGENHG